VADTDHGSTVRSLLGDILAQARRAGFLGPGPIEPHLVHAEGFAALARRQPVPPGVTVPRLLDLGSGGGLPGLVIAVEWPEAAIILLDANQRRTDFLRQAVSRLSLEDRVGVVSERAEAWARVPAQRASFDGVVVRSFGPPAVVAECAAPFLKVGGWAIVSEPPPARGGEPEVSGPGGPSRWPAEHLRAFGLEPGEYVQEGFGYQVLHQYEACPDRFPRRNGKPSKNPLF
jgi:16S rRNA (guanine527-N7)-methyltransferase